jgi:hypothetical protein
MNRPAPPILLVVRESCRQFNFIVLAIISPCSQTCDQFCPLLSSLATGRGSDPVIATSFHIVELRLTASSSPYSLRCFFACHFLIKSMYLLHSLRL